MSTPITEISTFSVAAQTEEIRDEILKIFGKADGLLRGYSGVQVEDPAVGYWIVEWESLEHYKTFIADEALQSFLARHHQTSEGGSRVFVQLGPSEHTAVYTAPATEICLTTLKPGVDAQEFEAVVSKMDTPVGQVAPIATAIGKAIGVEGLYVAVMGWVSVEAHKSTYDQEVIKERVKVLEKYCDMNVKHTILQPQDKVTA